MKKLHILVANDDGIHAEGIQTLAKELSKFAQITVIAPDRNRSAASGSLTLTNPLRPQKLDDNRYALNGTPADCVHLALNGFIKEPVDMVVSGINAGVNLGDDVLYSGTVATALEGRHLRLPAIAVSLAGTNHYDTAAKIVADLIQKMPENPLKPQEILNINVPDLPLDEIKGIQICKLGNRSQSAQVVAMEDPRKETVYWFGAAGKPQNNGAGSDFYAISQGYVSITPLQWDMTAHQSLEKLQSWV